LTFATKKHYIITAASL